MSGRIGPQRRVAVILATAAYVTGLGILAAPPGNTFGGSCNGRLSSPGLDASHEKGPVIIVGTPADEVIIGSKGDDTIYGNGGQDLICGGPGADDITGGDDDDIIFGESGDDTIRGGGGNDFISGGRGNDNISADPGENLVYGDKGDDILDGSQSFPGTKLDGGPGHDLCFVAPGVEADDCRF